MLKKTIIFEDYDGNTREEDFYFNLNKSELLEMQTSEDGGLDIYIESIVKAQDIKKVMQIFKNILLKSYGEKSADGRRFVKDDERTKAFTETEAYNVLFMELVSDSEKAAEFINGIIPADLRDSNNITN